MEDKKIESKSLCSWYLFIYSLSNCCYGACYGVFGPITPYLSKVYDCPESDFVYLFGLKAIAYLATSLFQRFYLTHLSLHLRAMLALVIVGITFIVVPFFKSHALLGAVSFLSSLMMCWFDILIAVCLIRASGDKCKQYISVSYGCMCFGWVIVSILTALIGQYAISVCGLLSLVCGLTFFCIQSPETQIQEKQKKEESQSIYISAQQQKYMTFCLLVYASLNLSIRNWMPSFITMMKIASEEIAALSILFYGLPLMVFRFIFGFSKLSSKTILKAASFSTILVASIALLVFQVFPHILIIFAFASITGISLASYYPSLLVLPVDFGKILNESNTAAFALYYAIGQGVLSSFVGYLMGWINPLAFLFGILALTIMNRFTLLKVIFSFQKKIPEEKSINVEIETERKANQNIQT